jgi:hypothetical protein
VLGARLVLFQAVSGVQPEFTPLVVFSQKYRVPTGFPLVAHWTWMLVAVIPEKADAPGGLARV